MQLWKIPEHSETVGSVDRPSGHSLGNWTCTGNTEDLTHKSGSWRSLSYLSWGCCPEYLHITSSCSCLGASSQHSSLLPRARIPLLSDGSYSTFCATQSVLSVIATTLPMFKGTEHFQRGAVLKLRCRKRMRDGIYCWVYLGVRRGGIKPAISALPKKLISGICIQRVRALDIVDSMR